MTEARDPKRLMAEALARIRRSQARIDQLEAELRSARATDAIALLGLGCRLPGGADDLDRLWELLVQGRDAIVPVPRDRWDPADWRPRRPFEPGRFEQHDGGFVEGIDTFDADVFGIPHLEADYLDPQHRLLLEVTWHALEDAGLRPAALRGQKVGVFVGLSTVDYAYRMVEDLPIEQVTAGAGPGTSHSAAAGRISYRFGWQGPSLVVDTACSSSLVALHLAMLSLRRRECDLAVVAGANAMLSPYTTLVFHQAGMLAPDGRCKGFDAAADGYGRGEGAVAVVLQRHEDAETEGRPMRALVRGSALNQDGASAGLTVPRRGAQVDVVRAALRDAGLEPGDIDAIEAHGTGTALGDPIEAAALQDVFGTAGGSPRGRPLFVASVKANLGHLEAAAGLAGIARAVLQLERGALAPQVHFRTPNPHFEWEGSVLEVPTRAVPWPANPRRIGVSSFGFSGTNAHVVLEQAPARAPVDPPPGPFVLSAPTRDALGRCASAWRQWLEAHADATLPQVAALSRARERHEVVAQTAPASIEALAAWLASIEDGADPATLGGAPRGGEEVHHTSAEMAAAAADRNEVGGAYTDTPPFAGGPLYPFARRRHWFRTGERAHPGREARARLWEVVLEESAPGASGSRDAPSFRIAAPAGSAAAVHEGGALGYAAELAAVLRASGATVDDARAEREVLVAEHADPDPTDALRLVERIRAGTTDLTVVVPPGLRAEGLAAAVRVAAAERPDLSVRLLRGGATDVAEALLHCDDEDDLTLLGGQRFAARLRPLRLAESDAFTPEAEASYAVTGAAGALGQVVVRWLLDGGAGRVLALHRPGGRVPPADPRVTAIPLDLADVDAVRHWAAACPEITGVFHLAGQVVDRTIEATEADTLETALSAKARGGHALYRALRDSADFRFFCSFGSAAAVLGNPGQLAYAAANGALPRGPRATVVAFGPWRTDRADSNGSDQAWQRRGIRPLAPEAALADLARALGAGVPSCLCLDVDWAQLQRSLPRAARGVPPLLRGLGLEALRSRTSAALADALPRALEDVLGRPLAHDDGARSLPELGVDSLLAVELRHRVAAASGVDLPLETLLSGASVDELAASRSLDEGGIDGHIDGLVDALDALPDEEIDRLLGGDDR